MEQSIRTKVPFSEHQWDLLLNYIGQRRVVPVVGPELLVAKDDDGRTLPFYTVVAKRLSDYFGLSSGGGVSFDDTLMALRRKDIPAESVRIGLNKVLKQMAGEPQPLLQKLVSIPEFELFLTTTPDNLLTTAIVAAGKPPEVVFFSRNYKHNDLPQKEIVSGSRYVYHLYGKAHPCAHYAMSEDERLEYSCLWMDSERKPRNLPAYLANKYLLVLGCGYENWLARFFLFGLKGNELFSNIWDANGLLADSHSPADIPLERFLSRCHGNIYCDGSVEKFVEELTRHVTSTPRADSPADVFQPGSFFISYASEDRSAALRVKHLLEEQGLPVWLDRFQLESGEDYDAKIRKSIRNSSFFLPILSKTTATITVPRYFRVEWSVAAEEARKRAPTLPFVHPIAIDDVAPCDNLPDFLNDLNWAVAPAGNLDGAVVERLVRFFGNLDA